MSDETTFCDHCAKPLAPSEVCAFGSCPVPTDSTNAGESAQLCEKCCESLNLVLGYETDDGRDWCKPCLAHNLLKATDPFAPNLTIPKQIGDLRILPILKDLEILALEEPRCDCCNSRLNLD